MNMICTSTNRWLAGLLLILFTVTSCGQTTTSDSAVQHSDSLSVKKMDDDSNSDMPVGTSKDSTVEIPNAYKPETKAQ